MGAAISGQFAEQWKLRRMAQEVALKEIVGNKLRGQLAENQSFECADVKVGDSVIFDGAVSRRSAPRRRGPAAILDVGETGEFLRWLVFARVGKLTREVWAR